MQLIKKTENEDSSQPALAPDKAYIVLVRFLNNPCPNIAVFLHEHMTEISRVAKQYEMMLDSGDLPDGYADGARLFLTAFRQVEVVLSRFGYDDQEFLEEAAQQRLMNWRMTGC